MKTTICSAVLLAALALPMPAALYYESGPLSVLIPDHNAIGTADALTCSFSGENPDITAMTLTFLLQGGDSGDLFGYLRLGNEITSPSYDLTTLIQSQSLNVNSATSYSIDFNTAGFQSAFTGQDPNNTWTLFFADGTFGDQTLVTGWSLDITAVPEPTTWALLGFGTVFGGNAGVRWWRRRRQLKT